MPTIDTPQVTKFGNESARPVADAAYALYWALKRFQQSYAAGDLGTLIKDAGEANALNDGSAIDGRTQITGGDVFLLKRVADDLAWWLEQDATETPGDGKRLAVLAKLQVRG